MSERETVREGLRVLLRGVEMAESWEPFDAAPLIDVAVRRWTSFHRRAKPNKRTPENHIQDLLKGLRESLGEDLIYEEPGWLEHVAERFGTALLAAERPIGSEND